MSDWNNIVCYPNPATNYLMIENWYTKSMAGYSIEVSDLTWQKIFRPLLDQAILTIDISSWAKNSMYFMKIIDNQQSY